MFNLHSPMTLMVDHKLEYTMSIRCTEHGSVLPWFSRDRWEGSPHMRIQHRKLKLKILNSRVRLPRGHIGIVF